MKLPTRNFILASVFSLISIGCVQQFAIRTIGGIIDEYGFAALNEENDLDLAEKAIASNLKLIETLSKGDPENENLLLLLAMGYTSYALGFAEDESVDRARTFYLRGRDYGLKVLRANRRFARALNSDVETFRTSLNTFSKDELPAIFWTAMGWGSYINLTLTEPEALADLPLVEAMMQYVKEKDSSYYYGGAHLFLGTMYGSRPKFLGGNLEASKRHFEECLKINRGNFLLTYVYYARSYAVQAQDAALFEELLNKVDNASLEVLPEARLPNAIAKKKAQRLLEKIGELF